MSTDDNQYRHLLRAYYGEVVERGNFDKMSDFFTDGYIAHFPGKDLDLQGLKEMLKTLHQNLNNINVEIESDKWCDGKLCHEILFQGNRKGDMSMVEWRSNSKWCIENGKCCESWPTTTIPYDKILNCCTMNEIKQQQGNAECKPQAAK